MNPSKIKGTRWESANVAFLSRWWPKVERAALRGNLDVGDITHPEGWAIEAKDKPYAGNLPSILREAEIEAKNKGVRFFVALVKNRRSKGESGSVEDGYAVTRTRLWAQVAWEHEARGEALGHIIALANRHGQGQISDSDLAVLVREAIVTYGNTVEDVTRRVAESDG